MFLFFFIMIMIIFFRGHKNIYNRKVENKYDENYKESTGQKSSTSL